MHSKTLRFLFPEPLRAFRKPGKVWSMCGTEASPDVAVWVQCYGTAYPLRANASTLVLVFPLRSGFGQDLWFDKGLHFPHGMVIGVSTEQYNLEPLSAAPSSIEVTIAYKTDAELAREVRARALWERHPDDPHSVVISLPDFLRTGDLGPIHLGMMREAVLDTLGKPDDWSTAETPEGLPAIFKYGDIEFYFDYDDGSLICVRADNFEVLSGGDALRFDPWILRQGTPQHEVEAQLAAQGIDYQRVIRPRDPPDMVFIGTSAGVELGFEPQPHDEAVFGLTSISWGSGRE